MVRGSWRAKVSPSEKASQQRGALFIDRSLCIRETTNFSVDLESLKFKILAVAVLSLFIFCNRAVIDYGYRSRGSFACTHARCEGRGLISFSSLMALIDLNLYEVFCWLYHTSNGAWILPRIYG